MADLISDHASLIDQQFPTYWRRSGGYNLDHLRRQLDGDHFNLASLFVGSEGTLGIMLEAELSLVPIPRHKALAIVHFADIDVAFRSVPELLELNPAAIELIDDFLLRLTRSSPQWAQRLSFVEGSPAALLIMEFAGDDERTLAAQMQALNQHLARSGYHEPVVNVTDRAGQANVWAIRKAGLNLLLSQRGDAKPATCIEDVAVPPANLADYMADLRRLLDGRGIPAALYAHASAGCIHTRPVLNLKTKAGVQTLVELTQAAAELARQYNGVPSSEHGDGLARGFLNPGFFGPDIYDLFRQVKAAFDPANLFNPGKIVDAPPPDRHLRYGPRL